MDRDCRVCRGEYSFEHVAFVHEKNCPLDPDNQKPRLGVVVSNDASDFTGNKVAAEEIRKIADLVEKGDIRDIVLAYDNRADKHYATYGEWDDRWRLLGAIEYCKRAVMLD